jgi:hypothetical protein
MLEGILRQIVIGLPGLIDECLKVCTLRLVSLLLGLGAHVPLKSIFLIQLVICIWQRR